MKICAYKWVVVEWPFYPYGWCITCRWFGFLYCGGKELISVTHSEAKAECDRRNLQ